MGIAPEYRPITQYDIQRLARLKKQLCRKLGIVSKDQLQLRLK